MRRATRESKISDDPLLKDLQLKEWFGKQYRFTPRQVDEMCKKEIDSFLIISDERNEMQKEKDRMEKHKSTVEQLRRNKI